MTANEELLARRNAAVPRGVAVAMSFFAERAENAELWDVEGRRFIDFAGGIAVLNTGHRHPKVMAAVNEQLQRFTHTCYQVVPYEPYVALAEKLNALAPGKEAKKTIFLTTGAEAIENAVKIARAATGRPAVISFAGGFHGRTTMAMALTGKVQPYKAGFGAMPGSVYHAPFPNKMHGISVEQSLAGIQQLFKADVDPALVAAILIEPVQGEGGYYVAPFELLQALRKLCDEHGILLISDEVQTGFARTGKMFAIEHSGVVPDLIATAKSLAGGFPLSAVVGKAEIMDKVNPGGLGGTYAGSPIGCAAGLAVIQAIEEEGLLARSTAVGEKLSGRLVEMARRNRFSCIGEVRHLGGMVAFELVKDRATNTPDPDLTRKLAQTAAANGLILLSCGIYANVIRIMVPLTASDAILDEGLDKLEASLDQALG